MRKIPLGVLAAAALTAGMALVAAPATAGVATTDDKCVTTTTEYQYWKVAQVWNDTKANHPETGKNVPAPGDDLAHWDYSKAADVPGGPYISDWYDTPQTQIYYKPISAYEAVDGPFWMGAYGNGGYTGYYTYHLKGTKEVTTDKPDCASDTPSPTPTVSETPSESPTPSVAPSSEAPKTQPSEATSSAPALQPVTEESPSASAAVPTSIDAGLAGDHAKDTKIPALWPVFALAGAAVIVLGLIIAMRRRRAGVDGPSFD